MYSYNSSYWLGRAIGTLETLARFERDEYGLDSIQYSIIYNFLIDYYNDFKGEKENVSKNL